MGSGFIISLRLGILTHTFMHGCTCRPFPAPIIPAFYAFGYSLKVVGIDPIGKESRGPIVNSDLHTFLCCHLLLLWATARARSTPHLAAARAHPPPNPTPCHYMSGPYNTTTWFSGSRQCPSKIKMTDLWIVQDFFMRSLQAHLPTFHDDSTR